MRRDVQLFVEKVNGTFTPLSTEELVQDPTFQNAGANYSDVVGNVSFAIGGATVTVNNDFNFFGHRITLDTSKRYRVTVNITTDSSGQSQVISVRDNGANQGFLNETSGRIVLENGTVERSVDFTPTDNSNGVFITARSGSYDFTVNSIRVRELLTPEQSTELTQLDLFDFEDINITDKVKDIRDIAKVFTGFSQKFSVPASPKNNRLFDHFYNADVESGFDQRVKHRAFIRMGGADYKEGRISLVGSSMKNNKPYSYEVVFYGKTVNMKDLIGDDELKDLTGTIIDRIGFDYTSEFVRSGLKNGYNIEEDGSLTFDNAASTNKSSDLIFPFISSDSFYFYDSNDGINPKDRVESRNIYASATTSPRGIYYKDLKPAIKSKFIIQAIQEKYGFEFSDEFFSDNNEQYEELYTLLHREKGNLDEQIEEKSVAIPLSMLGRDSFADGVVEHRGGDKLPYNQNYTEFDYPFSLDDLLLYKTRGFIVVDNALTESTFTYKFNFEVEVNGSGEYKVELFDSRNRQDPDFTFTSVANGGNDTTVDFTLPVKSDTNNVERYNHFYAYNVVSPVIKVSTIGGISAFKIKNLSITRVQTDRRIDASNGLPVVTQTQTDYNHREEELSTFAANGRSVELSTQMPKIKVLDYLTGLFKMFNLTAYYVGDTEIDPYAGKIRVRSVDAFYFDGKNVDITKYVDTSKTNVNRNKLYSTIDFTFEKGKTFAIAAANERTGDEFGNERLNNLNANMQNPLAFDGGKYTVKVPFEKVMYERMSDQAQENYVLPISSGWLANREENPIVTKPVLFYAFNSAVNEGTDVSGNTTNVLFDGGVYDKDNNLVTPNYATLTHIYRPSNSMNLQNTIDASINFGSEFDEFGVWDSGEANNKSLFNTYYRRYLLQIYDRQSRIYKLEANLPMPVITKLKMNDVVIIGDRSYRLNKMQLNLSTGKADLELMNDIAYTELDLQRPVLQQKFFTNNVAGFIVETKEGYFNNMLINVYVDGNLFKQVSYGSIFTVSTSQIGGPATVDITVQYQIGDLVSELSDVSTYTFS